MRLFDYFLVKFFHLKGLAAVPYVTTTPWAFSLEMVSLQLKVQGDFDFLCPFKLPANQLLYIFCNED